MPEKQRKRRRRKPKEKTIRWRPARQDDNDVVVGGGIYHITHDNMSRKRLREMP